MKRLREQKGKLKSHVVVPDALAAYGERFMSMFDDYDEQAAKKSKQAAAAAADSEEPSGEDSSLAEGSSDDRGSSDAEEGDPKNSQQQRTAHNSQKAAAARSPADSKLEAFLSGRKGNRGIKAAAPKQLSKEQLAAQQRQQEQQRVLERKLKKQFMSSKVDKIFTTVDPQQLAAAASAGVDEEYELTPEQFAAMKRDVEQLGASSLDKRSAKAYKAAMLAKLGAAADKRPRIPAKMGLGMAKKAKQREAVALQEAIAAGMVKAKGRGKKQRAEKAKQRDKGLMEAGPGFKNGVLRLPKSALRS